MSNKYILPELGYSYQALEPYIDAQTMEIHHSKHHATYVNNSNALFEQEPELYNPSVTELVKSIATKPTQFQTALRNNVGGHWNHRFFWRNLAVNIAMPAALEQALVSNFGSVDDFKVEFTKAATTRFGSGWAWLVVTADSKLAVVSTANQDNPLMGTAVAGCEGTPILALDVWEHAYYLKYQNRRPEYIGNFWNVVNWNKVYERYQRALTK